MYPVKLYVYTLSEKATDDAARALAEQENAADMKFGGVHAPTLTDDGWGLGYVAVGMYKWLVFSNIFYYFSEVNESSVLGFTSHLAANIPTGTFVKPYIAM